MSDDNQDNFTLRRQAETALSEASETALAGALEVEIQRRAYAEDLYRAAMDNALHGLVVYQDQSLVIANPWVCELTGYTCEELKFLRPEEFPAMVHPEDREAVFAWTAHGLHQDWTRDLEFRMIRRDGQIRWVQALITGIELRGRPAIQVEILNITQRKAIQAEHQRTLRHLERRVQQRTAELAETNLALERELLRSARARRAIRRRNRELRMLYAITSALNASYDLEALLTTALSETIGVLDMNTGWITLSHAASGSEQEAPLQVHVRRDERAPCLTEADARALSEELLAQPAQSPLIRMLDGSSHGEGGGEARGQVAGVTLAGPEGPLGTLVVAGREQPGARAFSLKEARLLATIAGQVSISLQNAVLAREAAEVEALRETSRVRSELLAGFSHNLRSPLGLITVASTTLLRDDVGFDRATQQEFLEEIRLQAGELARVVDAILTLERMDGGQLVLRREPADLVQIVQQVVEGFSGPLTQRRIAVIAPEGPVIAHVDSERIRDLLRNLVDNAIKYSPAEGEITVTVTEAGGSVRIQVRDQGIGIAPEDQLRIFERFYRVQNPVTRRVYGTGLGLVLCKTIAEAHGGRLTVNSTLGRGSTFEFSLPAIAQ